MKKIITYIFLLCSLSASAQSNLFTAGICHTDTVPAFNPGARGCRTVLDTSTMHFWVWQSGTTWIKQEKPFQQISGCSAPLYTPTKYQSDRVINGCSPIPLQYKWLTGTTWECLNCAVASVTDLSWTEVNDSTYRLNSSTGTDVFIREGTNTTAALSGDTLTFSATGGGTTYTAGAGIDITGTVISNTAPDQTVSLTGAGINAVTGTYPNFTVTGTEVDGSTTNEIQRIDTLSLSGNTLSASLLNDGVPASTVDLSGLGFGTVTSVGLDLPAEFVEAGTPVTTSGTLSATWATQTANKVFRSGDAGGTPGFSALTAADIPNLDAAKITTGTLGVARGGTGAATFTNNRVLTGNGTSAIVDEANLTFDGNKLTLGTGSSNDAIMLSNGAFFHWNGLGRIRMQGSSFAIQDNVFNNIHQLSLSASSQSFLAIGGTGGLSLGTNFSDSKMQIRGSAASTGNLLVEKDDGTDIFLVHNNNSVGIGIQLPATPDRLFQVESSDAVTNAVTYQTRISHITSGTATTGFGGGFEVELENGSGTNRVAQTQETTWIDAVDATEDATYTLKLIKAGTLTTAMTVNSVGDISPAGDLVITTAGKGLEMQTGTGQRFGNATLVGGTVTVTNATITANSYILLTRKTAGGTIGDLTYTLSAGASFTINSASGTDTSDVSYFIFEGN